jgi:hypothetical protein
MEQFDGVQEQALCGVLRNTLYRCSEWMTNILKNQNNSLIKGMSINLKELVGIKEKDGIGV